MDSILQTIIVNIPFIIAIIILIVRMIVATKRGMTKEICSLVATTAAGIAIILISFAIKNYINHDKILFVLTVLLIAVFGIIYKLIDGILTTLKLIASLPIIKHADKLLGVFIGIIEAVAVVWIVFSVVMIMDSGYLQTVVVDCVQVNPIMRFLYNNNLFYSAISSFSDSFSSLESYIVS